MSEFNRAWIIANGLPIVRQYEDFTLRALHYQLLPLGMPNDIPHYKKVVAAMIQARWDGLIPMDAFVDFERETVGFTNANETDVESTLSLAKQQIQLWTHYDKNRWENQNIYPEVFIEKKAARGVFEKHCRKWDVALNPCKGYPSLTFLNDAKTRFEEAMYSRDQTPLILYFGDYDCSGEDIPRSIGDNLRRMGVDVEVRRIILMEDQVLEWGLPPAPSKEKDTRSRTWNGLGQVEMDAVPRETVWSLIDKALEDIFDEDLYDELREQEATERVEFKERLRADFNLLMD